MWKDPILEEVYKIRARIARQYPGLRKMHAAALAQQKELELQGVRIVNLHKSTRPKGPKVVRHRNRMRPRSAV